MNVMIFKPRRDRKQQFDYSNYDTFFLYVNFKWQAVLIENKYKNYGPIGEITTSSFWEDVFKNIYPDRNIILIQAFPVSPCFGEPWFAVGIPAIAGVRRIKYNSIGYRVQDFVKAKWLIDTEGFYQYIEAMPCPVDDEWQSAADHLKFVQTVESMIAKTLCDRFGFSMDRPMTETSFIDANLNLMKAKIKANENDKKRFATSCV